MKEICPEGENGNVAVCLICWGVRCYRDQSFIHHTKGITKDLEERGRQTEREREGKKREENELYAFYVLDIKDGNKFLYC